MEIESDLRSRVVAWLKILLPLAALAVLSTLFLFSREIDPSRAIPYADVDVEGLAREPRLSSPEYSGVTKDGAAISVSAKSAMPDPKRASLISAENLKLALESPDGGKTEISAKLAELDGVANQVNASGGVQIALSSGYVVETETLFSALDRTEVQATGGVAAQGPLGSITAAAMEISAAPKNPSQHLLVFKDGVRLIYRPNPQDR